MSNITNIRDTAVREDASQVDGAPLYYRFGMASNLSRRVITTLPQVGTAEPATA